MKIKKKIKGNLLYKTLKLTVECVRLKNEINTLENKIDYLQKEIKHLKDLNYEISSNCDYLVTQRRITNRKLRQLKRENNELKNRLEEEK